MKDVPTVKRVALPTPPEEEVIGLFDDDEVADEVNDLASQFLDPVPVSSGTRIIGQIFMAIGAVMLVAGIILMVKGISDMQQASSVSLLSQTQSNLGVVFGGSFIIASLSEFALGAVLIAFAEMKAELVQSRRTLSAILETHLSTFEKS